MYKFLPSKLKSNLYKNYMWLKFLYNNCVALLEKRKVSYSDFSEDLILESIFEGLTGSYVDVGAGHPVIGSNSYLFYKKGWDGITVEPIKLHNVLHRLKRRRDLQINKLIGESKDKVKFYEFNPTQLSTNSDSQYKDMIAKGMKERRTYYLDSISINDVLSKVKNNEYFLTIDCEGYEYRILQGAEQTIRRCRPVIVIEQKPHDAYSKQYGQFAAVALLQEWGMIKLDQVRDDWIMGWR